MHNEHEPSDQFISNLNWQLVSEIRREVRFTPSSAQRSNRSGKVRAWMVGFTCFAMGIVGTTATQYLHKSPRAEYVLAKAQSDLEVAQARVDSTREILNWLNSLEAREYPLYFDQTQREREIDIAQERLEDALSELELKKLAFRESRVTQNRPTNELWTPLVNGEDLLSQRLRIELKDERRKLERFLEDSVSSNESQETSSDYLRQEKELKIEGLEHSIRLREQFLAGRVTKEELVDLERLSEAKAMLERMTGALDFYRQEYDETKALFDNGQISPLLLSDAEINLKRMEALLSITQKEVELLSAGLQPGDE